MAKKKKKDGEAEYWKEEADRVNAMSALAEKMGKVVKTGPAKSPKLNPNGTERVKKK